MENILISAHSGLRWIVLILLLAAIVRGFARKKTGVYEKGDKMLNLFAMVFVHIQITIGIVLAFLSPKVNYVSGWMGMKAYRFFGLEHVLLMLIAAVVITVGRKKGEQLAAAHPVKAHHKIAVTYLLALIIILLGIPWPFRTELGAGWI
jgi:membrane protein DedA with SNARE-associated domain